MTLILTAFCKNGICVCADKMSRQKLKNGPVNDGFEQNKIYKFANDSIIIFNHGVNKFNNRSWRDFCSEYENTNQWKGKNLEEIREDFKNFIEKDVCEQLKQNAQNFPTDDDLKFASFDLCSKKEFELHEISWQVDENGVHANDLKTWNEGLIKSGSGAKYVDSHLNRNRNMNTVSYWRNVKTAHCKFMLETLFYSAAKEKRESGGNEFSDDYDVDCIGY